MRWIGVGGRRGRFADLGVRVEYGRTCSFEDIKSAAVVGQEQNIRGFDGILRLDGPSYADRLQSSS
jgi:hypothetical protein